MIICHKYRFIFIKTMKTAGTSIEVFLSQFCDSNDIVTPIEPHVEPHLARNFKGVWNPLPVFAFKSGFGFWEKFFAIKSFINGQKFYNHMPAMYVRDRIPKTIWDSYYKFCVDRNPWDKTISHFWLLKHVLYKNLTFDQYLKLGVFCLNYPLYTDRSGNVLVDKVVKYDSLNNQLGEIFAMLGIPFDGDLGINAKSGIRKGAGNYREDYTENQRRLIEKIFSEEIKLNGYSW